MPHSSCPHTDDDGAGALGFGAAGTATVTGTRSERSMCRSGPGTSSSDRSGGIAALMADYEVIDVVADDAAQP